MQGTAEPPSEHHDDPRERLREHLGARFPEGMPPESLPMEELEEKPATGAEPDEPASTRSEEERQAQERKRTSDE